MKSSQIEVGRVYTMRWQPKIRLISARIIERCEDGSYLIEPVNCAREDGMGMYAPLSFSPHNFERRVA